MPVTTSESRDLGRLTERAMRNWELTRAQHAPAGRSIEPALQPFICISRNVGAGGRAVARRLGDQIGWPVFDRDILKVMAGDDAVQQQLYEHIDERDQTWMDSVLEWIFEGNVQRDDYFKKLSKTVVTLAKQAPAIFVGRGIDYILPRESGLRVRIIAPIEDRARWYAEQNDVSPAQARRAVHDLDEQRNEFLRNHFGRDANDPLRHDLVINRHRMDPESIADVILTVMQHKGMWKPADADPKIGR